MPKPIPLESSLRAKVIALLKEYDLYYESKPPTGMGASGLDLSVNLYGKWLSIEIKRSPQHHMTPLQLATARKIQERHGLFLLIDSPAGLTRLEDMIQIMGTDFD